MAEFQGAGMGGRPVAFLPYPLDCREDSSSALTLYSRMGPYPASSLHFTSRVLCENRSSAQHWASLCSVYLAQLCPPVNRTLGPKACWADEGG